VERERVAAAWTGRGREGLREDVASGRWRGISGAGHQVEREELSGGVGAAGGNNELWLTSHLIYCEVITGPEWTMLSRVGPGMIY
jgi:hypothetical protein